MIEKTKKVRRPKWINLADAQDAYRDINNLPAKPRPSDTVVVHADFGGYKGANYQFQYNGRKYTARPGQARVIGLAVQLAIETVARMDMRFADHGRRVA